MGAVACSGSILNRVDCAAEEKREMPQIAISRIPAEFPSTKLEAPEASLPAFLRENGRIRADSISVALSKNARFGHVHSEKEPCSQSWAARYSDNRTRRNTDLDSLIIQKKRKIKLEGG